MASPSRSKLNEPEGKERLHCSFTFCLSVLDEPLPLLGLPTCPSQESRIFHSNQLPNRPSARKNNPLKKNDKNKNLSNYAHFMPCQAYPFLHIIRAKGVFFMRSCSCGSIVRCQSCVNFCGVPLFCRDIHPCCFPFIQPQPTPVTSPLIVVCRCPRCSTRHR